MSGRKRAVAAVVVVGVLLAIGLWPGERPSRLGSAQWDRFTARFVGGPAAGAWAPSVGAGAEASKAPSAGALPDPAPALPVSLDQTAPASSSPDAPPAPPSWGDRSRSPT